MKTGGTQVKLPRASNVSGFKEGDTLVCIHSASCAYTKGKTYEVYKNNQGWKCLKADDGLEDILSMVLSTFERWVDE